MIVNIMPIKSIIVEQIMIFLHHNKRIIKRKGSPFAEDPFYGLVLTDRIKKED